MTFIATPHTPPEWLLPLSVEAPCGFSLEYDPDYATLISRLRPRGEAQYGDFVDSSGTPEWTDIERLCRDLMRRTRDINLLVWLCRARVRTAGASGLAQGLGMIADVLERWPEHVHPQLHVEGETDPAVRANAIAALCDPEGLLGDIRDIPVSSNAMRLTVRDVERAFTATRAPDSPQAVAMQQQLDALTLRAHGDDSAPVMRLQEASAAAQRIHAWCVHELHEHAPDLSPLLRLLAPFSKRQAELAPALDDADAPLIQDPPSTYGSPAESRAHVLLTLRSARQWFETNEPSSPVVVLLKQAERMVGQRFAQVADAIPLDLLRKWDAEPQDAQHPGA